MLFVSCSNKKQPKNDLPESFGESYNLIVCEKEQKDKNAYCLNYSYQTHAGTTIDDTCIQLPLITILQEFGVSVKDKGTGEFKLSTKDGDTYSLSLGEKELKQGFSKDNLIEVAPGTTHFCCLVSDNEMYLDSTTLITLVYDILEIRLDVSLDLNCKCVIVKTR